MADRKIVHSSDSFLSPLLSRNVLLFILEEIRESLLISFHFFKQFSYSTFCVSLYRRFVVKSSRNRVIKISGSVLIFLRLTNFFAARLSIVEIISNWFCPIPCATKLLRAFIFICGLAMFFCILRELIFAIRTDWFFLLGINFCVFQKVPDKSLIILSFLDWVRAKPEYIQTIPQWA